MSNLDTFCVPEVCPQNIDVNQVSIQPWSPHENIYYGEQSDAYSAKCDNWEIVPDSLQNVSRNVSCQRIFCSVETVRVISPT